MTQRVDCMIILLSSVKTTFQGCYLSELELRKFWNSLASEDVLQFKTITTTTIALKEWEIHPSILFNPILSHMSECERHFGQSLLGFHKGPDYTLQSYFCAHQEMSEQLRVNWMHVHKKSFE